MALPANFFQPNKGCSVNPPGTNLKITKIESATRQTEAAIEAFANGNFDVAITLAGPSEGMLERSDSHAFLFFRNTMAQQVERKALSTERDWLKHPSGPEMLRLEQWEAAVMIMCAACKLEKWTPRMEEIKKWLYKNADKVFKAEADGTNSLRSD
jgi:hypothetical protein